MGSCLTFSFNELPYFGLALGFINVGGFSLAT